MDWVLIIFGTQVIKKQGPVRPVFPDYLSISYDYDTTEGLHPRAPQSRLLVGNVKTIPVYF